MSTDHPFAVVPMGLIKADRSVLATYMALAGRSNSVSHECWPSYQTLADDTGDHRSTVIAAVTHLVDAGWIVKTTRTIETDDGKKQTSNLYQVNIAQGSPIGDPSRVDTTTPSRPHATTPSRVDTTPLVASTRPELYPLEPDPLELENTLTLDVTPATPNGVSAKDRELMFDAFWELCPRKKGKGAARKAFTKALKIADADEITAAMAAWAASPDVVGKDPQYVCWPQKWLNQERFTDPPWEDPADSDDPSVRYAGTRAAKLYAMLEPEPEPMGVLR